MADLNKVFLMGRLTFDPELRRTPSGTAVTELRMATTRTWTGRDGERREETLFIDVTVWDRQAENCCQYLAQRERDPRRRLAEDGHLGRQDHRREAVEDQVHADRVQFLDSRGDSGEWRRRRFRPATPADRSRAGCAAAAAAPPSRAAGAAGEPRGPANGPAPAQPRPADQRPRQRDRRRVDDCRRRRYPVLKPQVKGTLMAKTTRDTTAAQGQASSASNQTTRAARPKPGEPGRRQKTRGGQGRHRGSPASSAARTIPAAPSTAISN